MANVIACTSENFHPYECDGPGKCVHCDRRVIQDDHDPETCPLCEEPPLTSRLVRGDGMKPRLLDLFCGAGGAAMGYSRAGFEVVGVDIKPQPRYPFELYEDDALEFLENGSWDSLWRGRFDAIHASPPCQRYSSMTGRWGREMEHPDLIWPTRELLASTGLPYVIENVVGAPLEDPICLCGRSFALPVRRHRLFELGGFTIPLVPPCACSDAALQVNGHPGGSSKRDPKARFGNTEEWSKGMGIDWMTAAEMAEAIPPAYTEWIGTQFMAHLKVTVPS